MVGVMAKIMEQTGNDAIVLRARTDADALGKLYELYYERIFRFCVHRLFIRQVAEDVTSVVFLEVARRIRTFTGQTEQDFSNWLYAIATNQTNAYIRKTSRRRRLLEEAARSMATEPRDNVRISRLDWPLVFAAILKLKPQHQAIITLRFFENLKYHQIGQILNIREGTVRVMMHRILNELRDNLRIAFHGEK